MNELIRQARELCEKATPVPWTWGGIKEDRQYDFEASHLSNDRQLIIELDDVYQGYPECGQDLVMQTEKADAAFIAASRTLVPQLCDALEAAQKELIDYHHTQKVADGKTAENARMRKINELLTARAEKAEAENRWIPVSERLPKKPPDYFKDGRWWTVSGEGFIVADSEGKVYEAHWTYGCSCQNYFWYVNSLTPLTNITHWRPLPELPKGE